MERIKGLSEAATRALGIIGDRPEQSEGIRGHIGGLCRITTYTMSCYDIDATEVAPIEDFRMASQQALLEAVWDFVFSFPRSSVGMPARALCDRISRLWNAERSGYGFPRRAWEPAYE